MCVRIFIMSTRGGRRGVRGILRYSKTHVQNFSENFRDWEDSGINLGLNARKRHKSYGNTCVRLGGTWAGTRVVLVL